MRSFRGLWAGATLLLALAGCSKESDTIKGSGLYSPIITGISSNHEPAWRGAPNELTAQITNLNGLLLTYQWQASAGVLTNSTSATATWTPPDSIGTYAITVSVEAHDSGQDYFKTMTVQMAVDNEFARWTHSDAVQFDPAPVPDGGVLYSEIRSSVAGTSDAYRVDTPLGGALKLTEGFFTATSPTPRADQTEFAFAGKKRQSDEGPSIWLLPWGGGDTTSAQAVALRSGNQRFLANPRFAPYGTRLLYTTDSTRADILGVINMVWLDAANLNAGPISVIDPDQVNGFFVNFVNPNWGPTPSPNGPPDSLLVVGYEFYGSPLQRAVEYKFATPDSGKEVSGVLWLTDPRMEDADWSSDGNYVVFAKRNPGKVERDIWIINAAASDTSDAVRVTSGPADDSHPRFSRDGSRIFFVSNRVDRYGLNGIYATERRGTNIWSVARFDRPGATVLAQP